jgi:hypothetical protein
LLEVLFAIFVAAVGLLGLAALLTVGGVHTAQTEVADRSAAYARASAREVENRGMLQAHTWERDATGVLVPRAQWVDAAGIGQITYPTTRTVLLEQVVSGAPVGLPLNRDRLDPFVIDPLLLSDNLNAAVPDPAAAYFPFRAEIDATLRLPRMTLRSLYVDPSTATATEKAIAKAACERVFVCHDDVTTSEIDRQSRPQLNADENNDGQPDVWRAEGRYSYLVMVTPSDLENPYPNLPLTNPPDPLNPASYVRSVPIGQRRLFTVQVVVFHRRSLLVNSVPPSERQVSAQVTGNSAILQPPATVPAADQPAYLRGLAANQWILLSGFLKQPTSDPTDPNGGETNNPATRRPIHRWVRIVSVGKTSFAGQAMVNFGGPDWQANSIDPSTPTAATIVDGVVGVYEKVVELDVRSMTAP